MNSFFDDNGNILMLALDHRGSFEKMAPENSDLVDIKYQIINGVYTQVTGCLIDTIYGLPAYEKMPHKIKPFLLPTEVSGYTGDENARITNIEKNAQELKSLGASGVKILTYFDHTSPTAQQQLKTTKQALNDAHNAHMPFFLEIVTYGNSNVVDSVKTFLENEIIPDVFKIEYPGSEATCKEVDSMVQKTPWILLTRGDTFEGFDQHLITAQKTGCRGFLAGRSLWQEGVKMQDKTQRDEFFRTTLTKRFSEICAAFS